MNSVYISSAQTLVVMGTLTQQPQYYLLPNGTLINEQSGDCAAHICHLKHLDRQESGSPSESCTLTFATVHSCSLFLTLTHFILIWVAEEWSFPGLNYEKMYALSLVHFFLRIQHRMEASAWWYLLRFFVLLFFCFSRVASSLLQSWNPIKDSYCRKENCTTATFIFAFHFSWTGEILVVRLWLQSRP